LHSVLFRAMILYMKKRRSLNRIEQIRTIEDFLREQRWTQKAFKEWLETKNIIITTQYLNDVLCRRRNPGPKFKAVFYEITGIRLVDGLVEDK